MIDYNNHNTNSWFVFLCEQHKSVRKKYGIMHIQIDIVFTYINTYVYIHTSFICIYTDIYIYMCVYKYGIMHIQIHIVFYLNTYVYIHTSFICIYTDIYIYMCI